MIKEIDGVLYKAVPEIDANCNGCALFDEECVDDDLCANSKIIWVKCDLAEEVSRWFALLADEEREEIMAVYVGRRNEPHQG